MDFVGQQFGRLTINEYGSQAIEGHVQSGMTEQQAKNAVCGRTSLQLALERQPWEAAPSISALIDHLRAYLPRDVSVDIDLTGISLDGVLILPMHPREMQVVLGLDILNELKATSRIPL